MGCYGSVYCCMVWCVSLVVGMFSVGNLVVLLFRFFVCGGYWVLCLVLFVLFVVDVWGCFVLCDS